MKFKSILFLLFSSILFIGCTNNNDIAKTDSYVTSSSLVTTAHSSDRSVNSSQLAKDTTNNSGISDLASKDEELSNANQITLNDSQVPTTESSSSYFRDNTIVCLTPSATGDHVTSNSVAIIDYSNQSEGYICVSYTGTCHKVKLQITNGQGTTYTYNLTAGIGFEVFPLSDGDGTYSVVVYENVYDNQYAVALSSSIPVTISKPFGPNLYPNQYVNFHSDNITVKKAAELASTCSSDLEVVTSVYNYIIQNISYDYNKAETVKSGYTCDIDETLSSGAGICLDYASVMCAMLRSQRIPCRLEVGYAGTAYHAWISTYVDDIGWINGMIQFDGVNWSLMDPTFASTTDSDTLKSFINDSSNYQTKYIY